MSYDVARLAPAPRDAALRRGTNVAPRFDHRGRSRVRSKRAAVTSIPRSRVTDLRVLAVRADAPYAAPGQTVHLEALAIDPQERALTWGWGLCVNPASVTAPGCVAALDASTVVVEKGRTTFDFALPSDVISALPGRRPRPTRRSAPSWWPVRASSPQRRGALPFRCADAATGRALDNDAFVVGVKRIFARTADRNENPVIAQVKWDGADWPPSDIKDVAPCDESGNDYGACTANDAARHHRRRPPSEHRVGRRFVRRTISASKSSCSITPPKGSSSTTCGWRATLPPAGRRACLGGTHDFDVVRRARRSRRRRMGRWQVHVSM